MMMMMMLLMMVQWMLFLFKSEAAWLHFGLYIYHTNLHVKKSIANSEIESSELN